MNWLPVTLTLTLAFNGTVAASTPAPTLAAVQGLYDAGDFDGATRLVNDMLAHDEALQPGMRAELYLMKARVEFAFGRQGESTLWLYKAHRENPALTLDPVKDPPPLVSTWNRIQATGPTDTSKAETAVAATAAPQPSPVLPFGIPQAARGDNTKALALAAAGGALLTGAVLAREKPQRYLFVGLFAATWSYGIFDAMSVQINDKLALLSMETRF